MESSWEEISLGRDEVERNKVEPRKFRWNFMKMFLGKV